MASDNLGHNLSLFLFLLSAHGDFYNGHDIRSTTEDDEFIFAGLYHQHDTAATVKVRPYTSQKFGEYSESVMM